MAKIIRKSVAFEQQDLSEIVHVQRSKGLGIRGFSAAVRLIIREWAEVKESERVRITAAGREVLHSQDQAE